LHGRGARAAVLAAALAALSGCNAVLGPSQTDSNWAIHDRGRFTFYVRPGSFAEQSLDILSVVLDDQFASTVRTLDVKYDGHVTMFLYNNGAEAGFARDGNGGDHSGVAYPDTETVKTVAVPPVDANLFSLLQHEANHVIIRNGLGREGTSFMTEGLASAVISERYHLQGRTFYYHWTATHRSELLRIGDLVDDGKWSSRVQQTAYNESASFLAYLLETYGPQPLRGIYHAVSSDFAEAFRGAYGLALESAEAAWLAFCDARG
jgi:hypothetical protein